MGSDRWCRGADLPAGVVRAGSVGQGLSVSGLIYFGIKCPAGQLKAVAAVVGSAEGTAAAPWGYSAAATVKVVVVVVGSETLRQTEAGWTSPWRR